MSDLKESRGSKETLGVNTLALLPSATGTAALCCRHCSGGTQAVLWSSHAEAGSPKPHAPKKPQL